MGFSEDFSYCEDDFLEFGNLVFESQKLFEFAEK